LELLCVNKLRGPTRRFREVNRDWLNFCGVAHHRCTQEIPKWKARLTCGRIFSVSRLGLRKMRNQRSYSRCSSSRFICSVLSSMVRVDESTAHSKRSLAGSARSACHLAFAAIQSPNLGSCNFKGSYNFLDSRVCACCNEYGPNSR
jgi:hypothetical protein